MSGGAQDDRRHRGARSHHAGMAAEEAVERHYQRAGLTILEWRWRGQGGEIDLIARDGDVVVFVEVKQSASHDEATWHLTPAQVARISASVQDYVGGLPSGANADVRFDLALVDGQGQVQILANVLAG